MAMEEKNQDVYMCWFILVAVSKEENIRRGKQVRQLISKQRGKYNFAKKDTL